jgi:hypothetical protein
VVSLDHGTREIRGQRLAPWSPGRGDRVVELLPSIVVVEHSMFCGQDMGLTFYVHPDNAAKLLPVPRADLTPLERMVLYASGAFKSSYGGRDRYEMARDDYHCERLLAGMPYPSRAEWDNAKAALIAGGFLNKAGAITPAGRNAAKA